MHRQLLARLHFINPFKQSNLIARFLANSIPSIKMDATGHFRDKAIVKHAAEDDKFTFSVVIRSEELNVDKQINMNRLMGEEARNFMKRLNASVDKAVSKKKKKKQQPKGDEEEPGMLQYATFRREGTPLNMEVDTPIKDVLFQDEVEVDILGNTYALEKNPPTVESLKLSDALMDGFPVFPYRLELQFADVEASTFQWLVTEKKYEKDGKDKPLANTKYIERLANAESYTPTHDDIGRHLKVVCVPRCGSSGRHGCPADAVTKTPISAGPGQCPFDARHAFTAAKTKPGNLRFVSYNILAELYSDSEFSRTELFPQCPPYALDMAYRKQLLLKEILGYNSDVLCLQEVDSKIFKHDLLPTLKRAGMDGVLDTKAGQVSEGEACFWNTSKFKLVHTERLTLTEGIDTLDHLSEVREVLLKNEALHKYMQERTTVMQVAVLQSVEHPDKRIVVGNTHLFFKPPADQIRLLQAITCVRHLQHLLEREQREHPEKEVAIFLAGDFNSTPECGVYEFTTTGTVPATHPDWVMMPDMKVEEYSPTHGMGLGSACGAPKFTNYTIGFTECLDYIFYQKAVFSVTEVVPFPSEEELKMHQALPNVVFPSDHVACVAELKWNKWD